MDHAIAWSQLVVGLAIVLASTSAMVTLRVAGFQQRSETRGWLVPVLFLALSLLLLSGVLFAFWSLNLSGNLGR
jgi:hypothetical protein